MTDFNKEFETLQKYIDYRVGCLADYLTYGRVFYVNIEAIPFCFTPEGILALYQQMGLNFISSKSDTSSLKERKLLSFDEFKELCYERRN